MDTVTSDGTTHWRHQTRWNVLELRAEYLPGQQFLWFQCDGSQGILGYLDDPPKMVTCMLCLVYES